MLNIHYIEYSLYWATPTASDFSDVQTARD